MQNLITHHLNNTNKKYKNIGCAVGITLLLTLAGFFFVILKLITLDTEYTEREWLKYHLLTPDELRHVPRITNNYIIRLRAQDGNAAGIAGIKFHGTQDTLALEKYLDSLRYYLVTEPGGKKTWYSPDNQLSAQIFRDSEQSVSLIIYYESAPLSVIDERKKQQQKPAE